MSEKVAPSYIYVFTSASFLTLGLIFSLSYWNKKGFSTNRLFGAMALSGGIYYLLFGLYMELEPSDAPLIIISFAFAALFLGILPWFLAYYCKIRAK